MKTQQRVFRVAIKPTDPKLRFGTTTREKLASAVTKVSTSLGIPAPPKMVDYLRGSTPAQRVSRKGKKR